MCSCWPSRILSIYQWSRGLSRWEAMMDIAGNRWTSRHIASTIVSTKERKKENTMRKVIVSEYVTLDGVMEDPGGAEGFKHGGWSFGFGGADQQQYKFEELFACDALLLGRRTYEGFAAAWPTMPGTGEYGERMNSLPKYVVSTTLSEVEWNASLIKGPLAEEISKLKQQPGQDVLVFGSGELVHQLTQQDLIDE